MGKRFDNGSDNINPRMEELFKQARNFHDNLNNPNYEPPADSEEKNTGPEEALQTNIDPNPATQPSDHLEEAAPEAPMLQDEDGRFVRSILNSGEQQGGVELSSTAEVPTTGIEGVSSATPELDNAREEHFTITNKSGIRVTIGCLDHLFPEEIHAIGFANPDDHLQYLLNRLKIGDKQVEQEMGDWNSVEKCLNELSDDEIHKIMDYYRNIYSDKVQEINEYQANVLGVSLDAQDLVQEGSSADLSKSRETQGQRKDYFITPRRQKDSNLLNGEGSQFDDGKHHLVVDVDFQDGGRGRVEVALPDMVDLSRTDQLYKTFIEFLKQEGRFPSQKREITSQDAKAFEQFLLQHSVNEQNREYLERRQQFLQSAHALFQEKIEAFKNKNHLDSGEEREFFRGFLTKYNMNRLVELAKSLEDKARESGLEFRPALRMLADDMLTGYTLSKKAEESEKPEQFQVLDSSDEFRQASHGSEKQVEERIGFYNLPREATKSYKLFILLGQMYFESLQRGVLNPKRLEYKHYKHKNKIHGDFFNKLEGTGGFAPRTTVKEADETALAPAEDVSELPPGGGRFNFTKEQLEEMYQQRKKDFERIASRRRILENVTYQDQLEMLKKVFGE